ncbi:MAG TPA: D-glycero-beta-D-manno-heptose 1-phosphate adenylyltransferase [Terriglobia bacterium]|nr:D-glycero-beta-D-manno-heptose 1-phosphate adenylyltransferase [Terriglobia bacterium]
MEIPPSTGSAEKILPTDQAVEKAAEIKRQGKRLVFTNGCFDLLHPGHTRYLAEARRRGDALMVGVNSDRSVRALKGPERPITLEAEPAEILAALESVDYVTVFDDLTPQALIAQLLPDVLVKGADWSANEIVGREEVEAAGGQVISISVVDGFSTSALIQAVLRMD